MYKISNYTKQQAKKIGVVVKPSNNKNKKIDVYKNNIKIASIGAIGYKDYPTYMQMEKRGEVSRGTANKKQASYKARHFNNRKVPNSKGWYADKLLW